MRCGVTKCRHRFRIKRHPNLYVRPIKCPACGNSTKVRSIEEERRRELAKQETCHCGNYPFPHRRGSMRFCIYHPRIDDHPTTQEELDYEACLATPRGA